jgi:hypothetical protein
MSTYGKLLNLFAWIISLTPRMLVGVFSKMRRYILPRVLVTKMGFGLDLLITCRLQLKTIITLLLFYTIHNCSTLFSLVYLHYFPRVYNKGTVIVSVNHTLQILLITLITPKVFPCWPLVASLINFSVTVTITQLSSSGTELNFPEYYQSRVI